MTEGAAILLHIADAHPQSRLAPPAQSGGKAKKPPSYEPDPMVTRETLELVRAYYKIEDANVRNRLRELFTAIGAAANKVS